MKRVFAFSLNTCAALLAVHVMGSGVARGQGDLFTLSVEAPATREKVMKDREEGSKADLGGTPTVYINGRMYSDPLNVAELSDWIKEDLSVNR